MILRKLVVATRAVCRGIVVLLIHVAGLAGLPYVRVNVRHMA